MADDINQFFEKFKTDTAKMKEHLPEAISGFAAMFGKIMADGAISLKTKELIALAIAVSSTCKPCIRLHVQKCLAAGAIKEEVLEAASVAVMMAGGPAFTHLPEVINTLEAIGK